MRAPRRITRTESSAAGGRVSPGGARPAPASTSTRTMPARRHHPPLLINFPKLVVLVCAMLCITLLVVLDRVDQAAALPVLVGIPLYVLGNGVAVRSGIRPEPVVQPAAIEPADLAEEVS